MTFHIESGGAPMRRPDIDAFIARLVSRRAEAEYLAERLIEALDAADGDPDLEEDDPLEPSFGAAYLDERSDECEPDGDNEPSLGSIGSCCGSDRADQRSWARGMDDDRENDVQDDPHDEEPDDEPLLGSFDRHVDQRVAWAASVINLCSSEPELDRSDYEPTAPERGGKGFVRCGADDHEPSLGASNPTAVPSHMVGPDRLFTIHRSDSQAGWEWGSSDDDRELGDDHGIADGDGVSEQMGRAYGAHLVV